MTDRWTLVLHGGAGVNPARDYSAVEAHLLALVTEGARRLEDGQSALDVAQWAVAGMEASGLHVSINIQLPVGQADGIDATVIEAEEIEPEDAEQES